MGKVHKLRLLIVKTMMIAYHVETPLLAGKHRKYNLANS